MECQLVKTNVSFYVIIGGKKKDNSIIFKNRRTDACDGVVEMKEFFEIFSLPFFNLVTPWEEKNCQLANDKRQVKQYFLVLFQQPIHQQRVSTEHF